MSGTDRLSFLQALVTNDVATLAAGQGTYAAYLTPQGRMIADLHVFARADSIVADVPAAEAKGLADALDQLIFTEDVQVTDESASLAQLSVIGGNAAGVLSRPHTDADRLRGLVTWSQLDAGEGFIARTDEARLESFDVVVPAAEEPAVVQALGEAGAVAIDDDLAEAIRVDAGRPLFGRDMDRETIPLEAGLLERAISTTKGCYVGQEIVIRVLHRGGGRVARRLVKLLIDEEQREAPAIGATLSVGGRDIGRLTSVARALDDSRFVALGYVHRDVAEIGRAVDGVPPVPFHADVIGLAG